jgi:serine/threonine-protein kinase
MGSVFLAREVALNRMVALKLLPAEMAARPGVKERFLQETRTAAGLSHPNIVPIHTADELDDFVFFAMAYGEGGTLGDRVRDRGPFSHSDAVRLLREVAWANRSGARWSPTSASRSWPKTRAPRLLPRSWTRPPGQAKGGDVDARSDLYSLGCLGFFAIVADKEVEA